MCQVFYNGENRYVSIYDHECKQSAIDIQLQGNQQRKGIRQYRYDRRTQAAAMIDKRTKMVSYESITEVF